MTTALPPRASLSGRERGGIGSASADSTSWWTAFSGGQRWISGEEAAESEAGVIRYDLADQRCLASTNSPLAQTWDQNLGALVDTGLLTPRPPPRPRIHLWGATLPREGAVP